MTIRVRVYKNPKETRHEWLWLFLDLDDWWNNYLFLSTRTPAEITEYYVFSFLRFRSLCNYCTKVLTMEFIYTSYPSIIYFRSLLVGITCTNTTLTLQYFSVFSAALFHWINLKNQASVH